MFIFMILGKWSNVTFNMDLKVTQNDIQTHPFLSFIVGIFAYF